MQYSTLFKISTDDLSSEAEVETKLLAKLFNDLGYGDNSILPKKRVPSLTVNDGSRKTSKEVDFILKDAKGNANIIVEAKEPKSANIDDAWGQAASYALSYNRDKRQEERVKWLLISNGHITSLYRHDSDVPTVTLQLSDLASGSPPYVMLRSHIKYKKHVESEYEELQFVNISQHELNKIFFKCHDLVWKTEKLNPTDAFFEFCKFIFIKIKQDRIRENVPSNTPVYKVPLTLEWLETQEGTSHHPVRDILFKELHQELENAISREKKKRIFETDETFKLGASTCKELIRKFQTINLSSIDEDLNGRMFETFLTAAIRGRALGQYFTPRPVVDFMTRIGLQGQDVSNPPKIIDACSGTAGFLIEVMAYLLSGLREDTRFNEREKKEIKDKICNEQLYGIEANERVARIARINMYLHGDGGSHIFRGDGLDNAPAISDDMSQERKDEVSDQQSKIKSKMFDLVLSNPPFSMRYSSNNKDEKKILKQRKLCNEISSAKSNLMFVERYHELMKPGAEMLIILDDTIINGKSYQNIRDWVLDKFVMLGVHSLPFNAFFKAKANIKTSILHLRKKLDDSDRQGHIFMSISNNIGHDNTLKDTHERNNLNNILNVYLEWKRTGVVSPLIRGNHDKSENLECPEQVWIVSSQDFTSKRFDAFYYSIELKNVYSELSEREVGNEINIKCAKDLALRPKLKKEEKNKLANSGELYKYIEISDVTRFGLITNFIENTFDELPSRGEYQIKKGDLLFAVNNSSRGTVVKVPEEFDGAICTSGFLVIDPKNDEEANLLWYALRSEFSRKQIYYLAQTASQPELKIDYWKSHFKIPIPKGQGRKKALNEASSFFKHIDALLSADEFSYK